MNGQERIGENAKSNGGRRRVFWGKTDQLTAGREAFEGRERSGEEKATPRRDLRSRAVVTGRYALVLGALPVENLRVFVLSEKN